MPIVALVIPCSLLSFLQVWRDSQVVLYVIVSIHSSTCLKGSASLVKVYFIVPGHIVLCTFMPEYVQINEIVPDVSTQV